MDGAEGGDCVIALYEKASPAHLARCQASTRQLPLTTISCPGHQVQRTKNKWKVTLKDGLVSVNGREYLFAKCAG